MSSKLNNFFNLCRLANVLLSVYCKLLIYVETATVLLHVETGIIFNCSLVYDMKTLCTPNKQTKYFQRKLVLTAHSYYQRAFGISKPKTIDKRRHVKVAMIW